MRGGDIYTALGEPLSLLDADLLVWFLKESFMHSCCDPFPIAQQGSLINSLVPW